MISAEHSFCCSVSGVSFLQGGQTCNHHRACCGEELPLIRLLKRSTLLSSRSEQSCTLLQEGVACYCLQTESVWRSCDVGLLTRPSSGEYEKPRPVRDDRAARRVLSPDGHCLTRTQLAGGRGRLDALSDSLGPRRHFDGEGFFVSPRGPCFGAQGFPAGRNTRARMVPSPNRVRSRGTSRATRRL